MAIFLAAFLAFELAELSESEGGGWAAIEIYSRFRPKKRLTILLGFHNLWFIRFTVERNVLRVLILVFSGKQFIDIVKGLGVYQTKTR